MCMGDEDMAHRPATDGLEQGCQMRLVFRAWIDDGQRVGADDIAVRPVEGKRTGVVDGDARDPRRDRDRLAMGGFELHVEFWRGHCSERAMEKPQGELPLITERHIRKP